MTATLVAGISGWHFVVDQPADAIPAPAWAVNPADSAPYYQSAPVDIPAEDDGSLDVSLSRLDDQPGTLGDGDPGQAGSTTVDVYVGTGCGAAASLTPENALRLAEVLREHALRAAGPDGVEVPADRVRVGDELLTPDGWERVEMQDVDGWLDEGHDRAVNLSTIAHDGEEGYRFLIGGPVRIREAVSR
jgi:hypothetical protein